jgi:uncharacterized protein YjbI with pentapeptide repeats/uncharacterized protein YecT (DUF1311 family)
MSRTAWLARLFLECLAALSVAAQPQDRFKAIDSVFTACEAARTSKESSVKLTGPLIEGVDLSHATLRDLDLSGTAFKSVNLSGARLLNVKLCGAQLPKAKMRGAVICNCDLSHAGLQGADLGEARFYGVNLEGADLTDAVLENSLIDESLLREAVLRHANLRGLRFYCQTQVVSPLPCGAQGADFRDSDLRDSWMYGLLGQPGDDETPPMFSGARFDGASVEGELLSQLPANAAFDKLALSYGPPENEQVFTHSEIEIIRRYDPFSTDPLPNPFVGSIQPSFSCAGALSPVEKEICGESYLAEPDRVLTALFRELERRLPPDRRDSLRSSQRAWLEKRNECGPKPQLERKLCVNGVYEERIQELEEESTGLSKHPPVMAGYFRQPPSQRWVTPPDATVPQELRSKVARMFDYDAAENFFWIRKVDAGRLLVDAASLGANAHTCIVESSWFSDAGGGSFVEVTEEEGPEFRSDGSRLTFIVVEPYLLVRGGGGLHCGARAGWGQIYTRAERPFPIPASPEPPQ